MVGDLTLSQSQCSIALHRYPLLDTNGYPPEIGNPPVENPDWQETYDLHAAAADLLEEKASELAKDFDFATENDRFYRSQMYGHYLLLARWHRSRRAPKNIALVSWPHLQREVEAA